MQNTIGIDLGGTSIKTALITSKGRIIKKYETPTQADKGSKTVVDNIISSIEKIKSGKIE